MGLGNSCVFRYDLLSRLTRRLPPSRSARSSSPSSRYSWGTESALSRRPSPQPRTRRAPRSPLHEPDGKLPPSMAVCALLSSVTMERHHPTSTISSQQRLVNWPATPGFAWVRVLRRRHTAATFSGSGVMWASQLRGSLRAIVSFLRVPLIGVPCAVVRDRHAGRREARAVPAEGPMQADFFRHQADIWQEAVG